MTFPSHARITPSDFNIALADSTKRYGKWGETIDRVRSIRSWLPAFGVSFDLVSLSLLPAVYSLYSTARLISRVHRSHFFSFSLFFGSLF